MSDLLDVPSRVGRLAGLRHRLSNRSRSRPRSPASVGEILATVGKLSGEVAAPGRIEITDEARKNIEKSIPFLENLFARARQQSLDNVDATPDFTTAKTSVQRSYAPSQVSEKRSTHSPSVVDIRIRANGGKTASRLAKADSGSCDNFISLDTVTELELKIIGLQQQERRVYNNVEGGLIEAQGKVRIDWYVYESHRTRTTEFFVINTRAFDVILGEPFLLEQGIIEYHNTLWVVQEDKNKDKSKNEASQAATKEKQKKANALLKEKEGKDQGSRDSKGQAPG